ncbi:MAG TPA: GNAT family N-acetyltransferase [Streptosporangiaceae bacterium]|jgi:hypothetical protein
MGGHRLASLLDAVAAGRFPDPDGTVAVWPPLSVRDCGVFAFTAHSVICTDADPAWVRGQLPARDLGAPMLPPFLAALAARTGRRVNAIDLSCVAGPLDGPPPVRLTRLPAGDAHPRVARALRYRDDVMAWQAPGGVVLLGRGVAGRWEAAVEVDPGHRDGGLGRELARAARHLVPGGTPVWAQISPGNAASVRAFLAAGFRPAGAEALLVPAG